MEYNIHLGLYEESFQFYAQNRQSLNRFINILFIQIKSVPVGLFLLELDAITGLLNSSYVFTARLVQNKLKKVKNEASDKNQTV